MLRRLQIMPRSATTQMRPTLKRLSPGAGEVGVLTPKKLLAAAVVAGTLISGSVRATEPSEWCKGYGSGTTYISPRWYSCASNFLYVFMTRGGASSAWVTTHDVNESSFMRPSIVDRCSEAGVDFVKARLRPSWGGAVVWQGCSQTGAKKTIVGAGEEQRGPESGAVTR